MDEMLNSKRGSLEVTTPLPIIKPQTVSNHQTAPFETAALADYVPALRPRTSLSQRTAPLPILKHFRPAVAPVITPAPVPELDLARDSASIPAGATNQLAIPVIIGRNWPGLVQDESGQANQIIRAFQWVKGEVWLVLGLVLVGLVAHSLNMFNFPSLSRFDDEGIYVSQAWSVLRMGQLSPYSYFYDHAPGGWLLLASWMGLTGGPLTFGSAIDSGRVFIMLLHVAMIPLLYAIARKLGCRVGAATLVVLLFSISPLAVMYQRLVLLDNIMMFWLLLSLNLLLDERGRLSRQVLSGVCFALAILSKETAAFVLPAFLFIVWQNRWQHHGGFKFLGWFLPMLTVASLYPLFALFKGELLPAGYSLGFFIFNLETPSDKISLLDALKWQASRGGNGEFWRLLSGEWLKHDPVLVLGGMLAIGLNLLRIFRGEKMAFATGLLGLLPLYYLARGGLVFDFYVIFAIPFLALNLGILISPFLARLPRQMAIAAVAIGVAALVGGYLGANTLQPLYTQQPDLARKEALTWIKQNLPADSRIVTRNDMWTDLHENGSGGPIFPNAHSHWKVALDPAVKDVIFHSDWHNLDYIIASNNFVEDMTDAKATMILDALNHASLIKSWESDGNKIELWKVNNGQQATSNTETQKILGDVSNYLEQHFEISGGAYANSNGVVTSDNQANAMLRAVWTGNRAEFERVWKWTQANLFTKDNRLVWQWQKGKQINTASNAEGDTDMALALLLASKRWGNQSWQEAGQKLLKIIWDNDVVRVNGKFYVAAGDWATQDEVITINPAYFAPYAYRIFQEADSAHSWQALIEPGYKMLFDLSSNKLGATQAAGLLPDWIGLEKATGEFVPLKTSGKDLTRFGYEAPRTYWRIALDMAWSGDGRAKTYLEQAGFLRDEVNRKGSVSASYAHDGSLLEKPASLISSGGALMALQTLDPVAANRLYAGQVLGTLSQSKSGAYWDNPDDIYTQQWGWFMVALYANALPDVWHAQG